MRRACARILRPCEERAKLSLSASTLHLKEGCLLVCCDDDAAPRIAYKGLVKKLKPKESIILGETHEEAASLVETVLTAAKKATDFLNLAFLVRTNCKEHTGLRALGPTDPRSLVVQFCLSFLVI